MIIIIIIIIIIQVADSMRKLLIVSNIGILGAIYLIFFFFFWGGGIVYCSILLTINILKTKYLSCCFDNSSRLSNIILCKCKQSLLCLKPISTKSHAFSALQTSSWGGKPVQIAQYLFVHKWHTRLFTCCEIWSDMWVIYTHYRGQQIDKQSLNAAGSVRFVLCTVIELIPVSRSSLCFCRHSFMVLVFIHQTRITDAPLVSSAVELQLFLVFCADHLLQSSSGFGQFVFLLLKTHVAEGDSDSKSSDTPDRTWQLCVSSQYRRHTPHL